MKICRVLLASLFAIVSFSAAPIDLPGAVKIESYSNQVSLNSYEFSYLLSDGQTRSEKGILQRIGNAEVFEVRGSYSYRSDNGKVHSVEYISGVDGFKATVSEIEQAQVITLLSPSIIKTLLG